MSVVVAIKDKGKIYMGSDTMVTYGDSKRKLQNEHTQKVWAVQDLPGCVMGGVGSLVDINLVRYCTRELIPKIDIYKSTVDTGVIMQCTVPAIFETINSYREITKRPEDMPMMSQFVIGVQDHLFAIYEDGCVEEAEEPIAIGSGADAALASLDGSEGEDPYVRITKALMAASAISLYVNDPFVVIDNENLETLFINTMQAPAIEEAVEEAVEEAEVQAQETVGVADEGREVLIKNKKQLRKNKKKGA